MDKSAVVKTEQGRISLDDYFMEITKIVAKRSTCLRHPTGAVLVRDKMIISTGYNGAPRGLKHCTEVGCLRQKRNIPSGKFHELCRGAHAEINAIIQASLNGSSTEGAVLYCTSFPCAYCMKALINAKITKIIYLEDYPDELSHEICQESPIETVQWLHR
ncbi:MAG: dCMP deaminase family protein [Candidatus Bathyarchaeota archaeon]|nr:MAG: dCMP deaminase family protein [Candidatus Bathyarchaeota archaeon]